MLYLTLIAALLLNVHGQPPLPVFPVEDPRLGPFEQRADGHELIHDIKSFLIRGNISNETAIRNLVHVIFSRLHECTRDCSLHLSHNLGIRRLLPTAGPEQAFLAHYLVMSHASSDNPYSRIFSEQPFYRFCQLMLKATLQCCGGNDYKVKERRNHHSSDSNDDNRELVEKVARHYDRRAVLSRSPDDLIRRVETETYANRYLCIRTGDLIKRYGHSHYPHEKILPAALVKYILYGYNIIHDGAPCPIDKIHDLYNTISNDTPEITHEDLDQFLDTGVAGFPSSLDQHGPPPQPEGGRPPVRRWTNGHSHSSHHSGHTAAPNNPLYIQGDGGRKDTIIENNNDTNSVDNNGHDSDNNHVHGWRSPDRWQLYSRSQWLHVRPDYSMGPPSRIPTHDQQCFSAADIYAMFNIRNSSTISLSQFVDICPVLLSHTLTGSCRRAPPTSASEIDVLEPPSSVNSYLCGTLAVLVISLCSLFGACFLKLSNGPLKSYLMATMLSLAVGCLVADATLHLLPEILAGDGDGHDDDEFFPEALQKMCALLASVYAFFILELLLSKYHTHGEPPSEQHENSANNQREYENVKLRSVRKHEDPGCSSHLHGKINNQLQSTCSNASERSNKNTKQTDYELFDVATVGKARTESCGVVNALERLDSTGSSCNSRAQATADEPSLKGIKSVAWMIVIGDAIHNFADGLAIGAAFSLSFTKGISTSITVLCHEVPHELGDFAVLVSTGLSIQRAMVLNFVSSLTAFVGLYVGLSVGEQAEASEWIFSVGAGMFLYVALTDLVPECKEYYIRKPTTKMFFSENIGILLGYVAMLMLALYEEKLQIPT